jgi:hypothetical protein
MESIKRRLAKLESVINADPLAELERANPYLTKMRDTWEKTIASPAGAALQAEFDELLGPIQLPPPTGHVGIDARQALWAEFEAMAGSPHDERLFELRSALFDLQYSFLAAERDRD